MAAPKRRRRFGMDNKEMPKMKRSAEKPEPESKLKLFGKAKNKAPKKGKKKLPMKGKATANYGALRNVRSA
jgi:hypothetical protein